MLMCRQVAKALAEEHYWDLPRHRRAGLKLHVFLCGMCGRYHRQVMDFQDGVRGFLAHEEEDDVQPDVHLSEDARNRIRESLHKT